VKTFPSASGQIATIVVVLLLIPALVVPLFELSSRSEEEDLLRGAYQRQLDAILYSINQYALDVAAGWAGTFVGGLREERWSDAVDSLLHRTPSVKGIVVMDTTLNRVALSLPDTLAAGVQRALRANREKIDRLRRLGRLQYHKLEPVVLNGTPPPANVALAFVGRLSNEEMMVVALVLEPFTFIRRELAPRIRDAAGLEFVLSVESPGGTTVFVTDSTRRVEILQRKPLWVFPDLTLGIGLRGTTLEDLLAARFRRNLVFLVILDIILLGGAWFAYRSIRAESRLAAARSTLVSNVSHELRTPLSLIRMYAETLEMGRLKDESKRQEYYSTIVRETERLTRLVNNILNFSRIEAGKHAFRTAPLFLNEVVASVLDTYGPHYRRQGFKPLTELHPALPSVAGDREAVTEALINLVENAVKYSGEDRYLCLRTGEADGGVFVEVEDHGIGIAVEHQRKVFETFYRVPTGLVHETRGSGLGLTLVRRIMDAHGGSVSVRSAIGKGSTFRLWFPRTEEGRS
jgi:two-component system phosphate regulon sensor histidine kinase PhoR